MNTLQAAAAATQDLPASPSSQVSIDSTVGALHNGVSVGVFLFGILTVQLYYYFEHHGGDGLYIKGITAVSWILELIRTIAMLQLSYYLSVTKFGSFTFLDFPQWSLEALVVLCALMDVIAQVFYGLWIRSLSKNWYIPSICLFLALSQLSLILALAAIASNSPIAIAFERFKPVLIASFSCTSAMDLVVTISLCWYLRKAEGQLGIRGNILVIAESGLITLLLGIANIVTLVSYPSTYVWVATVVLRGQVEMNCILTCLNGPHLRKTDQVIVNMGKRHRFTYCSPDHMTRDLRLDIQIEKVDTSTGGSDFGRLSALDIVPEAKKASPLQPLACPICLYRNTDSR